MGAAEGDLAGGEIVEQGACALHLREVEFSTASRLGAVALAATELCHR